MGSTRTLTDSTGAVTDAYLYDAYGNLLDKTGSTINPSLYRGEQVDDDLSAYYLRARYYQPGIGRFLTTDPVEGFPTEPLSQHRYLYGNCNPVSMIDPSGMLSLKQVLITTGIVGILNVAGLGYSFTEGGEKFYAGLGKNWLPDAFVLGITVGGTVRLAHMYERLRNFINPLLKVSLPPLPLPPNVGMWFSGGAEALLSISSAELATFKILGGGVELCVGTPSIAEESITVYKGYVWNLWNAEDYEGWFGGFGSAGVAFFWDFTDLWYGGPWGVGLPIWSYSLPQGEGSRSLLIGGAYYEPWWQDDNDSLNTEADLIYLILLAESIDVLLHQWSKPTLKIDAVYWNIGRVLLRSTIWIQTAIAKAAWNRRSEFSIQYRQNNPRPERDKFHGGSWGSPLLLPLFL